MILDERPQISIESQTFSALHLHDSSYGSPGKGITSRIVLHSYVTNLSEIIHPLHHLLIDVVEYDEFSIFFFVFKSALDACLFLLPDLLKYISQDCMFVGELKIDFVFVLVIQRLDGLSPQTHDDGGRSECQ